MPQRPGAQRATLASARTTAVVSKARVARQSYHPRPRGRQPGRRDPRHRARTTPAGAGATTGASTARSSVSRRGVVPADFGCLPAAPRRPPGGLRARCRARAAARAGFALDDVHRGGGRGGVGGVSHRPRRSRRPGRSGRRAGPGGGVGGSRRGTIRAGGVGTLVITRSAVTDWATPGGGKASDPLSHSPHREGPGPSPPSFPGPGRCRGGGRSDRAGPPALRGPRR